jgi:hypothetical protein
MDFSGSGSRVVDKSTGATQLSSQSQASASASSSNKPSGVNKAKQGLDWSDQAALKEAIQQVRNDNDPKTWYFFCITS